MARIAEETVAPDEDRIVREFISFLTSASLARHPEGPIRRFNQARHSGCVEAEFTIREDLDDRLRVGIFAQPRTYRAWIRFANASSSSDREADVRGMSIKLLGVEGPNLTEGVAEQDFVLNSHPVMMIPGTKEFLDLLRAVEAGGFRRALYFLSHPTAARIALASRQRPPSHLSIPYWSTTPYLFGEGRAVKYVARPLTAAATSAPQRTDAYLRDAMKAHLARSEAAFEFLVQFQTDGRTMPIEDATVEWKVSDSAYVPVARIRIPPQDLATAERDQACERVAFNPWHCLADHRPLGSLNRARRDIYRALSQLREQRAALSS